MHWPQLFERKITLSTRLIAIRWITVDKTNHKIHWILIYPGPVDSIVHFSSNLDLVTNVHCNRNILTEGLSAELSELRYST